jgi:hypothetical protein
LVLSLRVHDFSDAFGVATGEMFRIGYQRVQPLIRSPEFFDRGCLPADGFQRRHTAEECDVVVIGGKRQVFEIGAPFKWREVLELVAIFEIEARQLHTSICCFGIVSA